MNNAQRKEIDNFKLRLNSACVTINNITEEITVDSDKDSVITVLTELESNLDSLADDIGEMRDDEQGKFDNMNEGLQESDNGQAIQQAAEHLDTAHADITTLVENLSSALDEYRKQHIAADGIHGELEEMAETMDDIETSLTDAAA